MFTRVSLIASFVLVFAFSVFSQEAPATNFDAEMAKKAGADDYGMRSYVFCILKTGPRDAKIKDKKQRDEIFAGHMANIKRLAGEGKLAVAGPFGGIFVFAVPTVEEAQKLVETDPVIKSGMMVAELTPWYGSAAMMFVNEQHSKVQKKSF